MMIDTRQVVERLRTIESLAVIPRVASTNLVARRVVTECIDNDLSLPAAMIVAGEQFAGRGRNQRTWSSPAGKGIYATALLMRPAAEIALVPLSVATIVAGFLRDRYALDARIKWPNDVLVGGKKIAGILIESRLQDDRAYLLVGIGVNVEPVEDDNRPNSVSIAELSPRDFAGLDDATVAFVEYVDRQLTSSQPPAQILAEWRRLTVHRDGDAVTCDLGTRVVSGTWAGIDDRGFALLRSGSETLTISAGDLTLV